MAHHFRNINSGDTKMTWSSYLFAWVNGVNHWNTTLRSITYCVGTRNIASKHLVMQASEHRHLASKTTTWTAFIRPRRINSDGALLNLHQHIIIFSFHLSTLPGSFLIRSTSCKLGPPSLLRQPGGVDRGLLAETCTKYARDRLHMPTPRAGTHTRCPS